MQVTGPITLTRGRTGGPSSSPSSPSFRPICATVCCARRGWCWTASCKIAATEIERTDGRYTQLYQGVASSCEVCADNPVPLWEIRARRVIHDQEERQLYFDGASFPRDGRAGGLHPPANAPARSDAGTRLGSAGPVAQGQ